MKYNCGTYKGYRIIQDYERIGNGIYGHFYACEKKGNRYYKIKDSVCSSLDAIKHYINNRIRGE